MPMPGSTPHAPNQPGRPTASGIAHLATSITKLAQRAQATTGNVLGTILQGTPTITVKLDTGQIIPMASGPTGLVPGVRVVCHYIDGGHDVVVRPVSSFAYGMSGSAHGNGTGNGPITLTHDDDDGYQPWSIVDGGLALEPPSANLFDLNVTVSVGFSAIPEHEYGSPNFRIIIPWGGDKAFANFYGVPVYVFNDSSVGPDGLPATTDTTVYASFSGKVLRAPGIDVARHRIAVEMFALNKNPPSTDPTGPPVADGVTWVAEANFEYTAVA